MLSILIPNDYSNNTIQAVKAACFLAGKKPLTITLLHCVPISDSITELLYLPSINIQQEKQNLFHSKIQDLKESGGNCPIEIRYLFQYGISGPILEQIVEQNNIQLGIMPLSNKAESLLHNRDLKDAMHTIQCPVLFLPEYFDFSNASNVVVFLKNNISFKGRLLRTVRQLLGRKSEPAMFSGNLFSLAGENRQVHLPACFIENKIKLDYRLDNKTKIHQYLQDQKQSEVALLAVSH